LVSGIKGKRLGVFENRVLRRIFQLKRDEIIGDYRKLHNNALLHNLYCSPNMIRMMKSVRMRCAGPVGCLGEKRNAYRWNGLDSYDSG
jgi:hypothetical protein